MAAVHTVRFYFDFISPYSWLALMQAERFAEQHRVRWDLRPVVYAALLDACGLIGPAEVPIKRRYTFHDIVRGAARLGLRVSGPPEHPFRSLEALRTLQLFREEPQALALAVGLSDACWGAGRALTDASVIAEIVEQVGLDSHQLARRIADPAIKQALRESTEEALARGVFGVPTFVHQDELFWGHDRLEYLADRLTGRATPAASDLVERMLGRPRGADRKRISRS